MNVKVRLCDFLENGYNVFDVALNVIHSLFSFRFPLLMSFMDMLRGFYGILT